MSASPPLRNLLVRLLVPAVWMAGAFTASLSLLGPEPLRALATLGVMVLLTLALLRSTHGWRAVPIVFAMAAMLTPVLVSVAVDAIEREIGSSGAVGLSSDYRREWWSFSVTTYAAVLLASPVGFFTTLGDAGLDRLRSLARRVFPFGVAAAAVLVALALMRSAQAPVAERYVESLPVHAVLPQVDETDCQPIDPGRHASRHDFGVCATPEVLAPPLAFHFHCRDLRGERSCSLSYRIGGGLEETEYGVKPGDTVHRDDVLGVWLVADSRGWIDTIGPLRGFVTMRLLAARIAPPLGWILAAAGGLAVAGLTYLLARFLHRAVDRRATSAWLDRVRGDLAIVGLTAILLGGSFLVAALGSGLLTP